MECSLVTPNVPSQEAEPNQTAITTEGGTYTAGNVATGGGDFVGRDQITIHVNTPEEAAALLRQLGQQNELSQATIERHPFEPETILIPAGHAWLGSDDGPEHERPRHQVMLPVYRIAKYPITNTQYAAFLKHNPQAPQPDLQFWFQRQPKPGMGNFPVVNLTWQAALAYCRWLAQVTERAYALPSEAHWERAARGREGRLYPWGDEWCANCANFGNPQITAVDAYPAGVSLDGCYDLLGNVEEWTSTLWGANERELAFPYPYRADDGREDPGVSPWRVLRGGSYRNPPQSVRATTRSASHPESKVPWRGFRVVINI